MAWNQRNRTATVRERLSISSHGLVLAGAFLSVMLSSGLSAQQATPEPSEQSMSNVKDVTGGMKYLLEDDDIAFVRLFQSPVGTMATSLTYVQTSNSQFGSSLGEVINETNPSGQWVPVGSSNSIGVGRLFEITSDDMCVLGPANGPVWNWFMENPATNFQGGFNLNSRFAPYGGVYTQIVMGNFLGNGLATSLLFYLSQGPTKTEWAMRVLSPSDPKTEQTPLTQGPEFYSLNQPGTAVPATGSIVAGDFNGDGKDEIALLSGGQTILFYSVDPATLTISQTGTLTLPQPFVNGTATLAAGRFRDTQNVELVAVGAVTYPNTTIYSIQITPSSDNTSFTPSLAKTNVLPGVVDLYGVSAVAASLIAPMVPVNQQLVFGEKNATYIVIGGFQGDFTFTQQSFSNLDNKLDPTARLLSLKAGNFDNQNSDGTHNPATQLETFTLDSKTNNATLSIFNIASQGSDWLNLKAQSAPQFATGLIAADAVAGDLQGRSLRLGPPEVVTIPEQIQPDIVLGVPPQHIDWVTPTVPFTSAKHPGCNTTTKPCILNLTVLPSVPAPSTGFSTGFRFSSTSNTQSSRKSTTSWSIATKVTLQGSITWGVPAISSVTVGIKNATQYAHDHVVANAYNHFTGTTQSITATTGFADHVFYTEKDLNVYYYPVLGQMVCPDNDSNCTQKQPEYVAFSVPDNVTHYDIDGATLEWYQPAHEAGNVLSYPWSLNQLQQQFVNNSNPISENPAPMQGTDSSETTYSTSWSGGVAQSKSTGSSNAVSNDFTFSAAKKGIFVNGGIKVQLKGGKSWSTLNENTSSLSESAGVAVNKPAFDGEVANCCLYDFGAYVFGQKNPVDPVFQQLQVPSPSGNTADIQLPGPLFVGFVADLLPNGSNGVSNFFPQAYTLPDVAVSHPSRWDWSKSSEQATFNQANASPNPLDDLFYAMRGFFISEAGANNGQNLTAATAGDQLTLSARIYNYSMVDTNSPSLAHPAASIHVRFYGQSFCYTGANCVGANNATCAPYSLCGNAFLIGEMQVASIPGFDSPTNGGTQPNWTITPSVNFDTTQFGNTYLIFWVVTWMEDANGNLIPEMPGHGLKANPAALTFQQIAQVPIETYSNNVGMYGVNSPFYIYPAGNGAPEPGSAEGVLQDIRVRAKQKLLLEKPAKIVVQLRAVNAPVESVTVTYYDGDPRRNGKLFDVQKIPHMDPDVIYNHRAFYYPQSCGVHRLFARAWVKGSPDILGEFSTSVAIDPIENVKALIASTEDTEISGRLRRDLDFWLAAALRSFERNHIAAGMGSLVLYTWKLRSARSKEIQPVLAKQLIGQARAILQCLVQSDGKWDENELARAASREQNR